VFTLNTVEPYDLVAALLFRLGLRQQRACVITSKLRCARAARCSTNIISGQPNRNRLDTALKVRASWRRNHDVAISLSRRNPQRDLGGDHKRTQIERRFPAGSRNPSVVNFYELLYRLHKFIDRQFWHRQALCLTHEALTVLLRAQRRYGAAWLAVSLNAFEDRLAIMQHC